VLVDLVIVKLLCGMHLVRVCFRIPKATLQDSNRVRGSFMFPVRAWAQGVLLVDGVALVPASISDGSANSFQHNYSL